MGGLTIGNIFFILKIEKRNKRNKIIVFVCLCTYQLKPRPPHPGPRWGFDLTSLQILANSHHTGAYWLVKPPPRWGNLFNSLTDFINISLEFSTSLLTNLLEQKGKYDNRPRYKYNKYLTISKHNDPYPLIKKSGYKMDDGVAHCYKFILKGNLYHLHWK